MVIGCAGFSTVIGSLAFSWAWHRYATHTDLLPPVGDTHDLHHKGDLHHQAHGDFVWVSSVLMVLGLIIWIAYSSGYISKCVAWTVIVSAIGLFTWEWYVHVAYHTPGHWLERFETFQRMRDSHFIHHEFPDKNFGISTHLCDAVMGTHWEY